MRDIKLVNDTITNEDWYLNHLSLGLRNSYGMPEYIKTHTAILKNINNIGLQLGNKLDIYNTNYFSDTGIDPDGTTEPILDFIAGTLGINRKMHVRYDDSQHVLHQSGSIYDEDITLTNYQLRFYIFTQVLRNNFNGTNEELLDLYNDELSDLGIVYLWNLTSQGMNPLTCNIYFTKYSRYVTTNANIIKLFLGGYLTIHSFGISYNYLCSANYYVAAFFNDEDRPNYIKGYYYNNQFYSDASHTELITPDTTTIYIDMHDMHTNNTYVYNGTAYVKQYVQGYYYNEQFYSDASHATATLITPAIGTLYRDKHTNNTYTYNGTSYIRSTTYYGIFDTSTDAASEVMRCTFGD